MNLLQNLMLRFLESHESELLSVAMAYVAKLWQDNEANVVATLVGALKHTPIGATATETELNALMASITKLFSTAEFAALEQDLLALAKK